MRVMVIPILKFGVNRNLDASVIPFLSSVNPLNIIHTQHNPIKPKREEFDTKSHSPKEENFDVTKHLKLRHNNNNKTQKKKKKKNFKLTHQ